MDKITGIDVSSNNGKIAWDQVASPGIVKFAFVKLTEGVTDIDSQGALNLVNARRAGIRVSPYHFFHPKDDPIQSAQIFLKAYGTELSSDLPPMLDFEVLDDVSIADAKSKALSWLIYVGQKTGRNPIVYSDLGFFEQLNLSSQFASYPLYIAEVGTSEPKIAAPWKEISFWQYSWTGMVPGITTKVDMDYFYGSVDQLAKL